MILWISHLGYRKDDKMIVLETVEILKTAVEKGMLANVFINNRAGGNAPMIAREIAKKFLGKPKSKTPHQMNLWDS